jgi:hypothetical protein
MRDILERLQGLVGVYIGDAYIDDDILDAKDEITRLREALLLADAVLNGANMNMKVVKRKIRVALKGAKKTRGEI